MKRILSLMLILAACSIAAGAQAVYTPAAGSSERAAILAALRVPVEKTMKQNIVFVTRTFNVQGNWAFVSGEPLTPAGKKPSLKGTVFEGEEDMFDDNFFGLLRKRNGRWRVVTSALGCTDVCYADWWSRYRAPKAIFPYTE